MTIEQVQEVVQNGLNALIGTKYFPAVDQEGTPAAYPLTYGDPQYLVDVGRSITEDSKNGDIVFNAMMDTIGKIIIENREYVPSVPSLYYNTREFGGLTEFIRLGLADILETCEMWNQNGFINYSKADGSGKEYARKIAEREHGFYAPKVHAKVYDRAFATQIGRTTLRDQLFTAFRDWGQIETFVAAQHTAVKNTMNMQAELYIKYVLSVLIGKANAFGHEIALGTEYNALTGEDITDKEKLMQNPGFLKYALSRIAETTDNMAIFSSAFNDGVEPSFTPKADNKLILLSKFANACKFNVRADTYHEELLGVGNYDRIPMWMGISDGNNEFELETVSKLMYSEQAVEELGLVPDDSVNTLTINNVIGLMYDKMSAGILLKKEKITSEYTANTDYYNTFYSALHQTYVNTGYNAVYFTLN